MFFLYVKRPQWQQNLTNPMKRFIKNTIYILGGISSLVSSPIEAGNAIIFLGYGAGHSFAPASMLRQPMQRQIFNSDQVPIKGQTGSGQIYQSTWSLQSANDLTTATIVTMPQLKITAEKSFQMYTIGLYSAVSGFIAQNIADYSSDATLTESNVCASVDMSRCPYAAHGFVSQSGSGNYNLLAVANQKFYQFEVGLTGGKELFVGASGKLSWIGEVGLAVQIFSQRTQFNAQRCTLLATNGSCSQLRELQGELRSGSLYSLGPTLNTNLRFEHSTSPLVFEIGVTNIFLFTKIEHTGYTQASANGTIAFSQTAQQLGSPSTENYFNILTTLYGRVGYKFGS